MDPETKTKESEEMGLRDLFKKKEKKEKKAEEPEMPEKARVMTEEETETEGQCSEGQNRFGCACAVSLMTGSGKGCPPGCVPGAKMCPVTGRICEPGRRNGIFGAYVPSTLLTARRSAFNADFRIGGVYGLYGQGPLSTRIRVPSEYGRFR